MSSSEYDMGLTVTKVTGVSIKEASTGVAVFVPSTGAYWYGNVTSGFILQQLCELGSVRIVSARLCEEYDVPEVDADRDVLALASELIDASVLCVAT